MKETKNYKLKLPEQTDNIDIDVLDGNFTELDRLIFEKVTEILETVGKKADTASPTLTGTPKAPTPASTDNSTRIATTAFVQGLISGLASASSVSSLSSSVSSFSSALESKADKASPTFTGTPKAPTPYTSENSTRIATTAFVQSILNEKYGSVIMTDSLDVLSATGSGSLDDTVGDRSYSDVLYNVQTTWGSAKRGTSHGTFNLTSGNEINLYIRLYMSGGDIYWDEYYDFPGYLDGLVDLGTYTCYGHRGDSVISIDYENTEAGGESEMSIRDAVVYLLRRVNS